MKSARLLAITSFLAVLGALTFYVTADLGAQPPAADAGAEMEVLGHGAIHEAFAQPAATTVASTAIVAKQPPAPVEELPPDVKPEGENVVWIPGYWAFDGERNDFVWISGFWRNVPPDRTWVAGYWVAEGAGHRWVSGYWAVPSATQIYYPPPPEPIAEAPTPPPNDGSFYVAGNWVYRDTRYVWRAGYWAPYRAGWMWVAPHYAWTPAGYVFIDGYWDYEFGRRGVVFAPVYFGPRYFAVNRVYRPTFAISTDLLFGSLFVRPSASFYFFGDYYGPGYVRAGYTPWLDYRYRGRYADPAWSYYAWQNRNTPRWEQDQRAVYVARQNGTSPVPPRRFNPQAAPQTNVNVNVVVPVQQLQTRNVVKLQPVSKTEQTTIKQQTEQTRALATSRQNVERKIDPKATRQQPVKADLPVQRIAQGGGTTPPPPAPPKSNPNVPTPKAKAPDEPRPTTPPAVTPPKLNPPKTETPKGEPKTTPPPAKVSPPAPPPAPPKVAPQPAPMPPSPPKFEPKLTPMPNVTPPVPAPTPAPKSNPLSTPPAPPKFEPKSTPMPNVTPPVPAPAPKSIPGPTPQIVPQPAPKTVPAPAPIPPPKAAPMPSPQPLAPPQPPRATAPPAPAQPPAAPKGKGKEKD